MNRGLVFRGQGREKLSPKKRMGIPSKRPFPLSLADLNFSGRLICFTTCGFHVYDIKMEKREADKAFCQGGFLPKYTPKGLSTWAFEAGQFLGRKGFPHTRSLKKGGQFRRLRFRKGDRKLEGATSGQKEGWQGERSFPLSKSHKTKGRSYGGPRS